MKILLVGNPNVGKSAIFTHLTGVSVITSNYPGTTVSYTKGYLTVVNKDVSVCTGNCSSCRQDCKSCGISSSERMEVIDIPGTYRLDPENEAERVAVDILSEGDLLVNVVDATNLERNLNLTLQLMEYDKPIILVLNMWDDTQHKGIHIDAGLLSKKLGIPVVCTNGLSGRGIDTLIQKCIEYKDKKRKGVKIENRWEVIGDIISGVQNLEHRHHTFLERLQDLSVHPIMGLPVAIISLWIIFKVIISAGEFLVGLVEKVFSHLYTPFILWLSKLLGGSGALHYLLIGNISSSSLDYEAAMGVLTTGVFMSFGLVLPYITVFYIVLGFLENLGYLPRIAIIFDRFLHKVGLHGFSVIPMMLAFGCNVPGVMAIRNLESRRERFITALLTCITIPCFAQTAIIFRTAGRLGVNYVAAVLATVFSVWLILGSVLSLSVKGRTTTLVMEIPPYRLPGLKIQVKTLVMRLKGFIIEAVPYVLGGILFINALSLIGVIDFLGKLASPIITGVFGLPADSVSTFIIGIVRKDAAVALLEPLGLTSAQTVTAVTVLILYFPCVATFVVLLKELGIKDTLKAIGITLITTLLAGGFINLMFERIFTPGLFIVVEVSLSLIVMTVIQSILEKRMYKLEE